MPIKKRTRGDALREAGEADTSTTASGDTAAATTTVTTAAAAAAVTNHNNGSSVSENNISIESAVENRGQAAPRPSRRDMQRSVAERRAAHFARPEPSATVSSTNSTTISTSYEVGVKVSTAKEQWPGPFSTAMRMIEERESARLNRETTIAMKVSESIEDADDEEELDVYDTMLKVIRNRKNEHANDDTSISGMQMRQPILIPTLTALSMQVLADNFSHVDDMGDLPSELRGDVALEVSKRRKLTNRALMAIVPEIVSSVSIPDCSAISEEGLNVCFQNSILSNSSCSDVERTQLQVLSLHNCGECFTDKIAMSLFPVVGDLEVLTLRGCFRLNDATLGQLLESTPQLRSLDISCSLRFSGATLKTITTLRCLTSLCLGNMSHIKDCDLMILASAPLIKLASLSLQGLVRITNKSVLKLTDVLSDSLTNLNMKGCVKMNGETLAHLRNHNLKLTHLDTSDIPNLSTADLLMFFSPIGWDRNDELSSSSSSSSHANTTRSEFQCIYMNNLHSLVDDVVIQLCLSSENSLQTLSLSGCWNLSGRMAMALIRHCTNLKILDISFVRSIEEGVVMEIVTNCLTLRQLSVWGCTQLGPRFQQLCRHRNIDVCGYLEKNYC